MPILQVVRRASWVPIPWKNGGGITHELWREPAEGGAFDLRFSVAQIDTDGPFSRFPGVDRTILLLAGPGCVLTRDDGLTTVLGPTGHDAPFSFLGEEGYTCTRTGDAPCWDFNVMVRRAWGRVAVERGHRAGVLTGRLTGCLTGRRGYVLSLGEGVLDGVQLGPWDFAVWEGEVSWEGEGVFV